MMALPPELRMVMVRGRGSRVYDAAGREYLDYVLGSGPLPLGHAPPQVVEAVQRQAALGSTYFALNEPAILLAEQIVQAVPCGEAVRFQTTGSEATFAALRLARAATGRDRVLKFEGGWHGGHDFGQLSGAPGREHPVGKRCRGPFQHSSKFAESGIVKRSAAPFSVGRNLASKRNRHLSRVRGGTFGPVKRSKKRSQIGQSKEGPQNPIVEMLLHLRAGFPPRKSGDGNAETLRKFLLLTKAQSHPAFADLGGC
jgi:hypothetical protein